MFIRIKNIKKNGVQYKYAYLVENKWKKRGRKGAKQRVKGYLGKVVALDKTEENEFIAYYNIDDIKSYVKTKKRRQIIMDLIRLSLINHGFKQEERCMKCSNIVLEDGQIINKDTGKNVVIPMNDGYMCTYTLKRLIEFKTKKEGEKKGYELAKYFVEAGLEIPQELFVEMFDLF